MAKPNVQTYADYLLERHLYEGQRLRRLTDFIASGGPLIDWDEVRREVAEMGEERE